jgi:tetratricopeptide (TPR) repeat protein
MKWLLAAGLLFFIQSGFGGFNRIARTNALKEEAREAYLQEDFQQAASLYKTLIDSFNVQEETVRLNYANSLALSGKMKEADPAYRELAANAGNKNIRSAAYQQLGIEATRSQNLADAATYFKEALKNNPENNAARYNYELAKKKLARQKEEEQQEQKQDEQIEPSEWAKELKKQAEQLVNRYRYQEAYNLMQEGLKQDPSVAAFNNFTERIRTIIQIKQL